MDKERQREYNRQYRLKNLEKKRARDREYAKKNKEKARIRGKAWRMANKEKANAKKREYNKSIPDKMKARSAVSHGLRDGKIKKGTRCNHCKTKSGKLEAHHHQGYTEENYLNIIWLCDSCHREVHSKYPYELTT
jgi:hypothetical protein